VGRTRRSDFATPLFDRSETSDPKIPNEATASRPVHDLRATLKGIHNYIYANDKFKRHAKVFEEIMKLLVLKLYDEKSHTGQFSIAPKEVPGLPNGDGHQLLTRFQHLFAAATEDPDLAGIFGPADIIDLTPRVLAFAVNQLHGFNLADTDAKGAAFQTILGPQIRGEKGQFFTPDPVKRLIVGIIDPKPNEIILDPAAGSAGLLVQAIDHIRRKLPDTDALPATRTSHRERQKSALLRTLGQYAADRVFGVEIDPTLVRVARLNVALQADAHGNIFAADALAPWDQLSPATHGKLTRDSVDIVITNPPFGTKGKVDDPRVLAGFPNVARDRGKQVPDILFLERIVQLLKPGGRAGIVLPYGDLANSSLAYVREFLRATCHIFAVVSLPGPTFRPAENSVKAAVLFIRKWPASRKPVRYPTFRAISRKIGYDMHERPTYVRDAQGFYLDQQLQRLPPAKTKDPQWLAANGLIDEDISHILREWSGFRSKYGKEYL